jgi:hypothetical protein
VKSMNRTIAPRTRRYTRTYSSRHPELVQSDLVRSRRHLMNESEEVMGGAGCNPMKRTKQGEQVRTAVALAVATTKQIGSTINATVNDGSGECVDWDSKFVATLSSIFSFCLD